MTIFGTWRPLPQIRRNFPLFRFYNFVSSRQQLLINHLSFVRFYNDNAFVTIPFTKWLAVPEQCHCYGKLNKPIWGTRFVLSFHNYNVGAGEIYFSAGVCGLLETANTIWQQSSGLHGILNRLDIFTYGAIFAVDTLQFTPMEAGAERTHVALQLQVFRLFFNI